MRRSFLEIASQQLSSSYIDNLSLSMGYFPDVLKKACVTPLIKNENLDNDNTKNF